MPGEGLRFKPEVMLTDDVAASFADPNQDWADAVDEDGNPYVDPMGGNIRLTFDYSALSNEQEAGDDGLSLIHISNLPCGTGSFRNIRSAATFSPMPEALPDGHL